MNKIIYIITLFLSFIIGGCHSVTETDPERIAKEFIFELYTFQINEARKQCYNPQNTQIELIASNIDQASIDLLKSKGKPTVSISNYEIASNNLSATVELELTNAIEFNLTNGQFTSPSKITRQVILIKTNEKWLVDSFK